VGGEAAAGAAAQAGAPPPPPAAGKLVTRDGGLSWAREVDASCSSDIAGQGVAMTRAFDDMVGVGRAPAAWSLVSRVAVSVAPHTQAQGPHEGTGNSGSRTDRAGAPPF
jgi:hypothetical protein